MDGTPCATLKTEGECFRLSTYLNNEHLALSLSIPHCLSNAAANYAHTTRTHVRVRARQPPVRALRIAGSGALRMYVG